MDRALRGAGPVADISTLFGQAAGQQDRCAMSVSEQGK